MTYIAWLGSDKSDTRSHVGGKASALSRLFSEGFPIPNGFSIVTSALDRQIKSLSKDFGFDLLDLSAWDSFDDLARTGFLQKIETCAWVPEIEAEIMNAVDTLGYPIAVRSSGLGEDGADKSSAGIYATVLGVKCREGLKFALNEVLRSAFDAPARAYFSNNGEADRLPKFSIFIQKLVEPEISGGCLTQEANAGGLEFVHIEMVEGHNEVIADGSVTPSGFTIDAFDLAELQSRPSSPSIRIDYVDGERVESEAGQKQLTLNYSLKAKLVDLCHRCFDLFDSPQEIEWLLKGDDVYLVQSRPMTSDIRHILTDNWRIIINREYGVQYASVSIDSLGRGAHPIYSGPTVDQSYIPYDGDFISCIMRRKNWIEFSKSTQQFMSASGVHQLEQAFRECGETYLFFCRSLRRENFAGKTDHEILDIYRRHQFLAKQYCTFIWLCYVASNRIADVVSFRLFKLLGQEEHFERILQEALKPDRDSIVARMFPSELRTCPENGAKFDRLLEQYAWEPCLDLHFAPMTADLLRSKIREAKNLAEPLHASVELSDVIGEEDMEMVRVAKRLASIRDQRDDYRRQCVWHMRQTLFQEIARRAEVLVEQLSFWSEGDIARFLEDREKPEHALTLNKNRYLSEPFAVIEDKGSLERLRGQQIERLLDSLVLETGHTNKPGRVIGQVVVPGAVSGIVRKVRGAHELGRVGVGDILVAHTTHPDFILAMARAAAIVTDEGGQNSHAAQVAREREIVCIIDAKSAMQHLIEGQIATVNAHEGVVTQEVEET